VEYRYSLPRLIGKGGILQERSQSHFRGPPDLHPKFGGCRDREAREQVSAVRGHVYSVVLSSRPVRRESLPTDSNTGGIQ
jgi:hypothetical protein